MSKLIFTQMYTENDTDPWLHTCILMKGYHIKINNLAILLATTIMVGRNWTVPGYKPQPHAGS